MPTLPTLYLGYHIPAADPTNPDIAALGALAQAVFGETSPLYHELVLKEQKVVTLMADAEPHRDPGLFTILARVRKPEDLPAVRKRIAEASRDAAKTPIDAERLDAIKSHLRYSFAASLRQRRRRGPHRRRVDRRRPAGPTPINELYAAYDRLTPADLQRVAARYFAPEQRDGDHPRDGEDEMNRIHRLASAFVLGWPDSLRAAPRRLRRARDGPGARTTARS